MFCNRKLEKMRCFIKKRVKSIVEQKIDEKVNKRYNH